MNPLFFICKCFRSIRTRMYHKIYLPFILSELSDCGEDVVVGRNCQIAGPGHMHFGSHIYIGPESVLYSTVADIYIGNYVNFGPNVSVFTGDHRTDVIGEYMKQLHDDTKLPENDRDVIIEDDVWVGSGAIILKGVTVGRGSVIAAGAIVTKSVPPYTIYIGQEKQMPRFSENEIVEHERLLKEKYGN